ncbi:cytochrome b5-like Heme/Steroid binding domain protein [Teladorsagia circumcincta]|uniref:Cytochrome b5-like Heme/Steroid binding domain protein n=1 Tax=Teladorsagia circumcincta TaxID=45464 RepID=A0A2G9TUA8_TELCI|nr:cytochrome b5-like Heme/Steroid binding domain protein [Teladorsagia circumcincta]
MDWVLAKKRMSVDHEELMKHNQRDDCWVHIFGQVYDVTSYLEFHPGGIPELMRAAGTDATDLFNQFHAWVYRPYTPVSCGSLPEDVEAAERAIYRGAVKITFLIKIYEQGICTPSLGALSVGDTVDISEPIGNIDLSSWISTQNYLLMLAAGTGLTPMVNVLRARLKKLVNEDMLK